MKTIAFLTGICLMALLLVTPAFGNPFLVCDPQAGVEEYTLEINGLEMPEFAAEPDGSMMYDLESLIIGSYTVRAKAGNIWGWSDWSLPFDFTKGIPASPSGLHLFF